MKAAQFNQYGSSDVIEVVEVDKPQIGEGKVLIKVAASSVNPFDIKLRQGLMKESIPLDFPVRLSGDLSGTVVEVGGDVDDFKVGDRVYGQAAVVAGNSGAMAEFASTKHSQLAIAPETIKLEHAAALPLVGISAVQALIEHADIQSEQKVLIHGGSGGIGTVAIELAKHLGAYVATTSTGEGMELVKKLGADEVIDYATEEFENSLQDYDVVYDTVGGEVLEKSYGVLRRGGVLVTMVGPVEDDMAKENEVKVMYQSTNVTTKRLEKLAELIDEGVITPHIGKTFPLDEASQAYATKESGQVLGKVLVVVNN